jgi:uncharacterized membrane protein SpoIIM required for sporulation
MKGDNGSEQAMWCWHISTSDTGCFRSFFVWAKLLFSGGWLLSHFPVWLLVLWSCTLFPSLSMKYVQCTLSKKETFKTNLKIYIKINRTAKAIETSCIWI